MHEKVTLAKRTGDSGMSRVERILQSISSLQGVTYYSHTRKKEAVLYEKCYMVDGVKTRIPLSDSYEHFDTGKECYYLQDDNSLGPTVYRAVFRRTEGRALMEAQNADAVKAGPLTIVAPEKLQVKISVADKGEALEVEVLMEMELKGGSFIESIMNRSLLARFEAIFKWFEASYYNGHIEKTNRVVQ